jgi:hypothetical protein
MVDPPFASGAPVIISTKSLPIHSDRSPDRKKMKHGDVSESRGTKLSFPHFHSEAVTRRSTRRLSRIAKGL